MAFWLLFSRPSGFVLTDLTHYFVVLSIKPSFALFHPSILSLIAVFLRVKWMSSLFVCLFHTEVYLCIIFASMHSIAFLLYLDDVINAVWKKWELVILDWYFVLLPSYLPCTSPSLHRKWYTSILLTLNVTGTFMVSPNQQDKSWH